MPSSRLIVSLLLAFVIGGSARAEPAVVKVFEAKVHTEPNPSAPVVHTFIEKTELSVSEESTNGWRRVRLPDQRTGWIQESALQLGAPSAPAATPTPTPPPATDRPVRTEVAAPAQPAPKIYVKDLDHFAELVKDDPIVGPQAQRMVTRRKTAQVMGYGGMVTGLGLFGLAIATSKPNDFNGGLLGVGGALTLGGVVSLLALLPSQGDALDAINTWNSRHPDQPFELPVTSK